MEVTELERSGRPKFQEGEAEILSHNKVMVSVSTSSNKLSYGEAFLTLTTHRVLFRFESPGIEKTCQHIPLSAILSYEVPKSSLFHRPTHVTLTLCNGITIELNFTSGGRKHFVEQLSLTRSKRSWEQVPSFLRTKRPTSFDPSSAGVGGVLRLVDSSKKQVDESLEGAFKDMHALMEKAQEMVALAERLQRSVANSPTDFQQSDNRVKWGHVMEDLTRLGIGSPVSREMSGSESHYYVELARQVYDFAMKHITRETTRTVLMPITLIDLYCLYNRARGTQLISPDDLLRACQLFASLGLKELKLEKFPSGVLALVPQHTNSVTNIMHILVEHITQHGPATALQVANTLHLSLPLVTHYLLQAEAAELLCRDESVEGLIFWPNIFVQKNVPLS